MGRRMLDFTIAGTQKGGTTTLASLMRLHPGVEMARVKETHFFDNESMDWGRPDYTKLDGYFGVDDGRLRGEATPITLYWRPAVRRLHAYNPNVRIVLLLRDPVERAYSGWRHVFRTRRDPLLFPEAIREGRRRVVDNAETEGLERLHSYVERSMYGAQVDHLLSYFPRASVHCEITEEFADDQAAALDRIAAFLGLDPFPGGIPIVHANRDDQTDYPSDLTAEDARYLFDILEPDVAAIERLIGRALPRWRRYVLSD